MSLTVQRVCEGQGGYKGVWNRIQIKYLELYFRNAFLFSPGLAAVLASQSMSPHHINKHWGCLARSVTVGRFSSPKAFCLSLSSAWSFTFCLCHSRSIPGLLAVLMQFHRMVNLPANQFLAVSKSCLPHYLTENCSVETGHVIQCTYI